MLFDVEKSRDEARWEHEKRCWAYEEKMNRYEEKMIRYTDIYFVFAYIICSLGIVAILIKIYQLLQ